MIEMAGRKKDGVLIAIGLTDTGFSMTSTTVLTRPVGAFFALLRECVPVLRIAMSFEYSHLGFPPAM
jgi:hypothetical protein